MRRVLSRRAAVALIRALACGALAVSIARGAELVGEPLDTAIALLESRGLRIFYSTDLVKPWMQVETEPDDGDPIAMLTAILLPHGLEPEVAGNGSVLIVRATVEVDTDEPADSAPAPARIPRDRSGPQPLEEVVVSTSRYPLQRDGSGAAVTLGATEIQYQPGVGDDALRAAHRLPGMATNGLSAKAHVRGGDLGETLVLFDGLRLFDPFHLKDFQSIFAVVDPRIVSSMDVYTGAFPAAFGDRMSSVINVDTIAAPDERQHEFSLSFFNTSLLSTGQVADGRGEWVVSARRSNLDLLYRAFSDLPERPRYTDAFAKFSYDVSPRLTVTGNLLQSTDDLALADDFDREERAEADHSDRYHWLTLDHRLSDGLSGRTLLSHASLSSMRTGTSDKAGISSGSLTDRRSFSISSAQSEWSWPIGDDWHVEFGGNVSWVDGNYDYADAVDFDVVVAVDGAPTESSRSRQLHVDANGRQASTHITVRRRMTDRITGDFGLRWDHSTLAASSSSAVGPRIGLRFDLSEATELRASAGRIYQTQAINELQIPDGIDRFLPPQHADHFVVSIQHEFLAGHTLRMEAYRKRMSDLWPRYENLLNSRILLPELRPDRILIEPDSSSAHGLELMFLSRRDGPVNWWLSYSWSRAEDRLGPETFERSWDQPHALGAGFDWKLGGWRLAIAASYRSGWPTTAVALDDNGPTPVVTTQRRNEERLGAYQSVDLLATRTFELERSALELSFELSNLFDRSNPCCIEYEIGEDEEAGQLLLKELRYLPVVPSIGIRWSF